MIPGPVVVATITPHSGAAYIPDLTAFLDLLDFLADAGAHGVAALGSTGEFPHLSLEDRTKLIAAAAKRGRIPVIAGVTHTTLDGTLRLAEEAADAGAVAVLIMPPYYFRYRQPEIREFYLRCAGRIGGKIPALLYNIPLFTTGIPIETACELLSTGAFAGIKDSSGDLAYFRKLSEHRKQTPFTILAGADGIFARARREGADGVVSGVACAVPELLLALDRAIQDSDTARAAHLESRLAEFLAWLDKFPVPIGIREAVSARGLPAGDPAIPLAAATRRDLDAFRDWFRVWLAGVQRDCAQPISPGITSST
jgi:dihydrodipicolinate synthase/N-acetylneuraminate lyase